LSVAPRDEKQPASAVESLRNVVQDFLKDINADVQTSKFSIEKTPEGMKIEINFLALIRPRTIPNEKKATDNVPAPI
jgi:hypothetical protein